MKIIFLLLFLNFLTVSVFAQYANSTTLTLQQQLCSIITGVRTIIGVIALLLFFLGGLAFLITIILFLFELMANNEKVRENRKHSRNLALKITLILIVLGIIGIILVILAPFIALSILGANSLSISC